MSEGRGSDRVASARRLRAYCRAFAAREGPGPLICVWVLPVWCPGLSSSERELALRWCAKDRRLASPEGTVISPTWSGKLPTPFTGILNVVAKKKDSINDRQHFCETATESDKPSSTTSYCVPKQIVYCSESQFPLWRDGNNCTHQGGRLNYIFCLFNRKAAYPLKNKKPLVRVAVFMGPKHT